MARRSRYARWTRVSRDTCWAINAVQVHIVHHVIAEGSLEIEDAADNDDA